MLKSHLLLALRSLRKQAVYSFINITGLAVGIAACVLILLYVLDELSYDRWHTYGDRVYRITQEQLDENGSSTVHRVLIDPPIAPLLKDEFPEVQYAARLTPVGPLLNYQDKFVDSGYCYWTDPDIFEIFSIPLAAGDPRTALIEPFTLVISRSKALAIFGQENPIGKSVNINNGTAFTVTGVFEDLPSNTHLPIDVLGSMASLERWMNGPLHWDSPNYVTYLRLNDSKAARGLEAIFPSFLMKHRGEEFTRLNRFHLQSITDIHLHSNLVGEMAPGGNIRVVYLLSLTAALILLIACINFVNLTTARSTRRAREVAVRKVNGARRSDLIRQFLGESLLLTLVSLFLALLLVQVALPSFNGFTGKSLSMVAQRAGWHVMLILGIGLIAGVLAGGYPAFLLSAFRPVAILKGNSPGGRQRSLFRSALVTFQFVVAIILIAGTIVIYRQLSYVRTQDLGFDKDQILILPELRNIAGNFQPFREELLRNPDILSISQSNPVPFTQLFFTSEASVPRSDAGELTTATVYPIFADEYFFPTYDIPFAAGRNFGQDQASDAESGFILNEAAVKHFGWSTLEEAVNHPLHLGSRSGKIVGVVEDFHFESMHHAIAPMIFYMYPENYRRISVKVRAGSNLTALIDFLEDKWQLHQPNRPLEYSFLDEQFGAAYEADRKLGKIFFNFAFLAILVTCLGLFGMATFNAERRTREIGIRKALGASVPRIMSLLLNQFVKLVALAFIIAVPVSYFGFERWLDDFAYRITIGPGIFLFAGVLTVAVALTTIGYQSLRAALTNPAEILRYE